MLFSRQTPPRKIPINLNQVVEQGLYFLEARCVKEGIEIIRLLAPDLPEITADPSQLHQVLVNIIVNAIQAIPNGGQLKIQTKAAKNSVTLLIKDTGIGMSDEIRKQIFLPFFTTKDVDQGTGLGLAVVHGIITSHGGTIKVKSKPNAGSCFEIQLPVSNSNELKENGSNDTKTR